MKEEKEESFFEIMLKIFTGIFIFLLISGCIGILYDSIELEKKYIEESLKIQEQQIEILEEIGNKI